MSDTDGRYRRFMNQLAGVDLRQRAEALELEYTPRGLLVPLFGRRHWVGPTGITAEDGAPVTEAIGALLLSYLLNSERILPSSTEMMSFREITGAGPLVSRFAANTNKLICDTFATDSSLLARAAAALSGEPAGGGMTADLWMRLAALPHIPLYLRFNERDDMLPAQCQLMFERTAESYLLMEDLFTIGTYLAGELLTFARESG